MFNATVAAAGNPLLGENRLQPAVVAVVPRVALAEPRIIVASASVGAIHLAQVSGTTLARSR